MNNDKCMQQVLKEQYCAVGPSATLDADIVSNMQYLQCCIKEALRLRPPLIMLMRMALKVFRTSCSGKILTISKGDICVTSPLVSGHLEDIFENADQFITDRFMNDKIKLKEPFSFLGFGGGMHACMGQQFGLLQIKTVLSVLFRMYKFESAHPATFPEPDYTAMVMGPKGPVMVRYQKIKMPS